MQFIMINIYSALALAVNGVKYFLAKYYAELGMSGSEIGLMTTVPFLCALALIPFTGMISDRVSSKKRMVFVQLLIAAAACALFTRCTGFVGRLITTAVMGAVYQAATPIGSAISLDYCARSGHNYAPIRMFGSVGYILGVALVALFPGDSLSPMYPVMAVILALSAVTALLMPDGTSGGKSVKLSFRPLFADPNVRFMLLIILVANITCRYDSSFGSLHLGNIGMTNEQISVISMVGVFPEVVFLLFMDRIRKRVGPWWWILTGLAMNVLRWAAIACCRGFVSLMLLRMFGLCVMTCLEMIPAYYLADHIAPEYSGSAQSLLTFLSFGVCQIIGGMAGGWLVDALGTSQVYLVCSGLLAVLLIAAGPRILRLAKAGDR